MKQLKAEGFTLIELLVTLALLAIASAVIFPLASLMSARAKESELRGSLITIRKAIDSYKAAADSGLIDKPTGSSGYPPSLQVLATGMPRSAAAGANSAPLVFLRRIPRDPFHEEGVPAEQTWNIRSYGNPPGDFRAGADVFDISSKSERRALDGSSLKDW